MSERFPSPSKERLAELLASLPIDDGRLDYDPARNQRPAWADEMPNPDAEDARWRTDPLIGWFDYSRFR